MTRADRTSSIVSSRRTVRAPVGRPRRPVRGLLYVADLLQHGKPALIRVAIPVFRVLTKVRLKGTKSGSPAKADRPVSASKKVPGS